MRSPESIQYVTGDATEPIGTDRAVIVHCCNDVAAWGAGFVLAISRRWPKCVGEYRMHCYVTPPDQLLGSVHMYHAPPELGRRPISIANLIGQHDVGEDEDGRPPIRYGAIKTGLRTVSAWCRYMNASLHMPRMGCGIAGGTWDKIEACILAAVDPSVSVTVYDLPGVQ